MVPLLFELHLYSTNGGSRLHLWWTGVIYADTAVVPFQPVSGESWSLYVNSTLGTTRREKYRVLGDLVPHSFFGLCCNWRVFANFGGV